MAIFRFGESEGDCEVSNQHKEESIQSKDSTFSQQKIVVDSYQKLKEKK